MNICSEFLLRADLVKALMTIEGNEENNNNNNNNNNNDADA